MDKKIKILCTLGPSSLNEKTIISMDELGVDLFRINLSHTDLNELEGIIRCIRQYTSKPICLDTEGAQVRTGRMENGKTFLENNSTVKLVTEQITGNARRIPLKPDSVLSQIKPGDLISLDFESALLQVMAFDQSSATAKVVSGGFIGSNKAVAIDRLLDLPVMTEKDIAALSAVIHVVKEYRGDTDIPEFPEKPVRIISAIILADTRMVAPDNKMAASEIFPAQGRKYGLSRACISRIILEGR